MHKLSSNFSMISLLLSFDAALSFNCPLQITVSSSRASTVTGNEDWKNKVGRYIFRYSENGNAVYENAQQQGIHLYKTGEGNWMVGNKLGEDFGWIANTKCSHKCPTSCPEGSWIYWHGVTGGKGVWKSDNTLKVDGCVKWRQTSNCDAEGSREPENDKDCNVEIKWKSGYCECTNGRKEMEKGCQEPTYYGFEFKTCEEACAYRGILANGLLNRERMQSDQPIADSPRVPLRPGHEFSTCSSVSSQTYTTYEDANTACLNDRQCSFVLDEGCDDSGTFKLCTAMSMIQDSSTDCIFNKHN